MHFGEYELSPSLISLSPLPSSHPKTFQRLFGPPGGVTQPSTCSRVDHLVSRLLTVTITHPERYALLALLRLAFASATRLKRLTLPL